MKVICFGVRKVEEPIFHKFNKYNYELTLKAGALNESNTELLYGYDAIVVRASDKINQKVVDAIVKYNIKYLLTCTVGVDHIDLEYAHKANLMMARVPSYSPNAIAELAVSEGSSLLRKSHYFASRLANSEFKIDAFGFAKEIRNSTVGIIGTGKIGSTTAKLWKGLGAKVIGYDIYQSDHAKQFLDYVEFDELLKSSDLVSFQIPYIKGVNDKMINDELIAKMKEGAVLVNTARGQIQDEAAILRGLKSNHLSAVALDTLNNEKQWFNKDNVKVDDKAIKALLAMYPRVMITPHIGSYTDEAVANMVEFSFDNLNEYITLNKCKNKI